MTKKTIEQIEKRFNMELAESDDWKHVFIRGIRVIEVRKDKTFVSYKSTPYNGKEYYNLFPEEYLALVNILGGKDAV